MSRIIVVLVWLLPLVGTYMCIKDIYELNVEEYSKRMKAASIESVYQQRWEAAKAKMEQKIAEAKGGQVVSVYSTDELNYINVLAEAKRLYGTRGLTEKLIELVKTGQVK